MHLLVEKEAPTSAGGLVLGKALQVLHTVAERLEG